MADISAIKLPDGITYNVKDNEAVTDVTINSASIVNNGVASIPSASSSSYGVIKAELTSLDPPRPIVRFTIGFDPGSTTFDVPRLSDGKVPTYLLPIADANSVDVGLMDDTAFELFCDNSGDLTLSYNTTDLSTTSITPSKIGAVPTSRTVNSKALSSDITLSASDVGAVPTTRTVNSKALSSDITLSASDVGALASADLYTRSSSGGLDWGTGTTGNMVIAKSALAFWNGSYDGITSNVQRLNSTVYIGETQMKDFVKEQGTSSSWYYRKWNSGKIEAWRTYNAGSQTPAQWVTGWYYKDIDIAIPSGIFSAAPNHTVATNNGSDYQYTVHVARATSATNIRVRCVKPNSGAATPVIALYVSNMV